MCKVLSHKALNKKPPTRRAIEKSYQKGIKSAVVRYLTRIIEEASNIELARFIADYHG